MKTTTQIVAVLFLIIFNSCGEENNPKEELTEVEQTSEGIEITNSQFELSNMSLGTLSPHLFHKTIQVNGMLDVPPENKSTVSAYFGGYVKHISLLQGQKIAKGQKLFTLENPEYIEIQQDFLEAKSQLKYLKADYERQKELALENVSSQKNYSKSESDYNSTLAKYESLKKKLKLMNINPKGLTAFNMTSTILVKAPISGYVTSVMANKGQFLNPSDIALTIMNTDHIHAELTLFEQNLSQVKMGQEVSFKIQNGNKNYKAAIFIINKAIDPEKRTVTVHCHLEDETDTKQLIPGMFIEAEIFATSDSCLALPIGSVVSVEEKSYVLVNTGNKDNTNSFERVEVQVGQFNQKFVEVLNAKDFEKNTQFLTNGAFNLIQE